MNQTKFRVWDKKLNQFVPAGEVVFAFYGDVSVSVVPNCLEYMYDTCHNGEPDRGRFIVSQFTGLYDGEGNEIYEGDVFEAIYSNVPDGFLIMGGKKEIISVEATVVFKWGMYMVELMHPKEKELVYQDRKSTRLNSSH